MPPKRLLDDEKKPAAVLVQVDPSSVPLAAAVSVLDTNHAATSKVTVPPIPRTAELQNKKEHFMYYKAITDGNTSETDYIEVEEGEYLATIKRRIRNDNPSFDLTQMKLFESERAVENDEPLNQFGIVWSVNVNWGTIENPLIVNVGRFKRPRLQNNNDGVTKSPWSGESRDDKKWAIEKGESFVNAILQPYVDIPNSNGMKVLPNVGSLAEGEKHCDVVLRSITEGFWSSVITNLENDNIRCVCAVGTPGIGKTKTTCILIRLLLTTKVDVNVVFCLRTTKGSGFVYIFTPVTMEGKLVKVNVDAIIENKFSISDINKPTTYYVVDPGDTTDNCNLDHGFQGKVIIVASPDDRHWGESSFSKARNGRYGIFLYFPVWELDELIAASTYLNAINNVSINEEEIQDRFFRFGGVPRHVFMEDYKVVISAQEDALCRLSVGNAIELAYTNRSAIQTSSSKLPKGMLLSYHLSDDDNGAYRNVYAVFCSDYVYEWVANKYKQDLFTKMIIDRGDFDPNLFESYCRTLLYDSVKPTEVYFTVKRKTGSKSQNEPNCKMLGGCSKLKKVENVMISARKQEMILFTPYSTKYKLVDFGYRKNNVFYLFQATIGKNYSANPEHIRDLVVNELKEVDPSLLTEQEGMEVEFIVQSPQFEIYYLVPEFVYEKFSLQPANASIQARELISKKTALYKQWNDIVSIYIYCFPFVRRLK